MREIRPSGSEGGVALTTPFLPLSKDGSPLLQRNGQPFGCGCRGRKLGG